LKREPSCCRFRAIVWIATLAAVALELATSLLLGAILLQAAGYLYALFSAHQRTLAYATAPSSIVAVDLAAPAEGFPGGPLVALPPFVFLAALAIWVASHLDRLPARFPVHWGLHGADRWVVTTPTSVFGLLAVHTCLCFLPMAAAWGLLHWSRRIATGGPAAAAERHFRRRVAQLLVISAYFVVCPAWFALFAPAAIAVDIWAVSLIAVVVILTAGLVRGGQGGARSVVPATGTIAGDRTPDSCWRWGIIYVNANDPALLVEKRFGIGYTINFGHRKVWAVLALVLVPAAAALIFLR
jgi:uncharacterized membrane protein